MTNHQLASLYGKLPLPVLVCKNSPGLPVEYMNVQAVMLFAPSHTLDSLQGDDDLGNLDSIVNFSSADSAATFQRSLTASGTARNFAAELNTFDGTALPVAIYGNLVAYQGEEYFVLYLLRDANRENTYAHHLADIISAALLEENVDDSIDTVLALAGRQTNVSRVYVFEEVSPTTTRNTYEWCAPGVEPAIQDLQDLPKEDYPYDAIIESGVFVVNDIDTFDDASSEILKMQGIRSLAIIPIYDAEGALGYAGFDDTRKTRCWSHEEIQFLKSVAMLLASLMKRRNSERRQRRSENILQIITDNSEDTSYANRLDDYTLLFVSASLARALGCRPEDLLGRPCYEVLQNNRHSPCPFCPIPHIQITPGADRGVVYEWENKSNSMGKVYLAKDNIVRWVDGNYVHMQVATDISQRIEYEENLRRVASTDAMTGVYNREWGTMTLEERLTDDIPAGCLCFIDLDGLKKVNDSLGHAYGDEFITETVRAVSMNLPEGGFMCRWGGDEFLVWVELSESAAAEVMERAVRQAEMYNLDNKKPFTLSFSYGIVPARPGDTLDTLVTQADKLMYQSKMEKRGIAFNRRREDADI